MSKRARRLVIALSALLFAFVGQPLSGEHFIGCGYCDSGGCPSVEISQIECWQECDGGHRLSCTYNSEHCDEGETWVLCTNS